MEDATLFKVEYACYLDGDNRVEAREFKTAKSLTQWADRNDNDNTIGIFILRKLALIDGIWEPYTTIGKQTITLTDLKMVVKDLETTI